MRITDFGYNGEGVGHVDGKVCFVPYTIVGEDVEIETIKENSSFIKARLINVTNKSNLRQIPPCPYFAKCGGCDFQHISYNSELNLKKQILLRHLKKVGFEKEIEIISSDKEYEYRNKIKLFCNERGLGLKKAESDCIVNIDKCLLIDEDMNLVLQTVQNFVKLKKIQHFISNVIIQKKDIINVWFIFNKEIKLDFVGLSLLLGNNCNIYCSVGKAQPKVLFEKSKESVESGLKQNFSVNSFYQVNNDVCKKLYNRIVEEVNGKVVVNCYSGAGLLSGLLSKKAKQVYGIELGIAEHTSAEKLRQENDISNLINLQGYCEKILPNLEVDYDSIILDPPRSGCDKCVCEAVNGSNAKQLIYISCNPASLIRDLGNLTSFKIKEVLMFDMFPRTANEETLVILQKGE